MRTTKTLILQHFEERQRPTISNSHKVNTTCRSSTNNIPPRDSNIKPQVGTTPKDSSIPALGRRASSKMVLTASGASWVHLVAALPADLAGTPSAVQEATAS